MPVLWVRPPGLARRRRAAGLVPPEWVPRAATVAASVAVADSAVAAMAAAAPVAVVAATAVKPHGLQAKIDLVDSRPNAALRWPCPPPKPVIPFSA